MRLNGWIERKTSEEDVREVVRNDHVASSLVLTEDDRKNHITQPSVTGLWQCSLKIQPNRAYAPVGLQFHYLLHRV